jgi:farnesyl diphosphate synthase
MIMTAALPLQLLTIILTDLTARGLPPQVVEWVSTMFQYNLTGGKQLRSNALLSVYEAVGGTDIQSAQILGSCIEILQASFLVADDVIDNGDMRRGIILLVASENVTQSALGRPCWWKLPHVGTSAINDALLLESIVYVILKRTFREHKNDLDLYIDLSDMFREV